MSERRGHELQCRAASAPRTASRFFCTPDSSSLSQNPGQLLAATALQTAPCGFSTTDGYLPLQQYHGQFPSRFNSTNRSLRLQQHHGRLLAACRISTPLLPTSVIHMGADRLGCSITSRTTRFTLKKRWSWGKGARYTTTTD